MLSAICIPLLLICVFPFSLLHCLLKGQGSGFMMVSGRTEKLRRAAFIKSMMWPFSWKLLKNRSQISIGQQKAGMGEEGVDVLIFPLDLHL